MSLFNLFNRPKVEKTRGYVEPGLAAPLARRASKTASIAHRFKPQKKLPTPPPKSGNWEAPPLSQAYPQAIKFGTAQTSSADGASVLRIQRTRKNGSLQVPTPEFTPTTSEELRESGELKRNARLQTHNFTSSSSNPELPRKIFVLCTTGHILQYSARGPSDRYPDKVLLLSKESAAFACDLVLGKPYVLQIAQSVDGQGAPLAASPTSLFARMGLKSASSRRATPSMLLVLESAAEMDAWMVAVRKQIEVCGGKRGVRPDAAVGHKTEETVETFSKRSETPTHRYQVRRDPKRISVIASPIGDAGKEEQVVPLEVPEKIIGERTQGTIPAQQ
ncbi:hypothetical protein H2203_001718 [Taxawa tesnikishii (nom. ined.)]|nr:hypothetical protein H2203_001718 [Dothideales sp. JES 119]